MQIERYTVEVSFRHAVRMTFSFSSLADMNAFAEIAVRAEGVEGISRNTDASTQFGGEHGFQHLK